MALLRLLNLALVFSLLPASSEGLTIRDLTAQYVTPSFSGEPARDLHAKAKLYTKLSGHPSAVFSGNPESLKLSYGAKSSDAMHVLLKFAKQDNGKVEMLSSVEVTKGYYDGGYLVNNPSVLHTEVDISVRRQRQQHEVTQPARRHGVLYDVFLYFLTAYTTPPLDYAGMAYVSVAFSVSFHLGCVVRSHVERNHPRPRQRLVGVRRRQVRKQPRSATATTKIINKRRKLRVLRNSDGDCAPYNSVDTGVQTLAADPGALTCPSAVTSGVEQTGESRPRRWSSGNLIENLILRDAEEWTDVSK
ncbi:Uu.00g093390.m01.CDS01 [Anthostomella pinea]|uniref:Uu.00g093390.m01.CDS01 n=1 Tax=Anthostomella pinea TaxID=933095 RepID=A0AAI8VI00_9PEZI|nr:Uu.00g093390.m01.CDS01 [Anthostomella pinea]